MRYNVDVKRRPEEQILGDNAEAQTRRLRIGVVSLSGAARHTAVLGEMQDSAELEIVTPRLSSLRNVLVRAATVHPSHAAWRSRYTFNAVTHRLLRMDVEERLRSTDVAALLVLYPIVFAMPPGLPYVIVTDNTLAVTQRAHPNWEPLTARGWRHAIDRERKVLTGAAFIATESQQARDSMVNDYGIQPDRVKVTSIAPTVPALGAFPERGPELPDNVLFAATSFSERKGADVLRRAWPLIRDACPSARLQVVGSDSADVTSLVGATGLGSVSPRVLADLYVHARVLFHPAPFESSLPNVIREAMGFGLPVVATRTPAICEHSPPLADLAAVADHEHLARLVIDLLKDRERADSTGRRLYEYAARRFRADLLARELMSLLQEATFERAAA